MNTNSRSDYGIWSLVIINSLIFIVFAFSFVRPKTSSDWRSLGGFSAFIIALFTEMYGFPLTIYLLAPWLSARFPGLDIFSHDAGHFWQILFGWRGDQHLGPFHVISLIFIFGGLILLMKAWPVLHKAQREHALATSGSYARVRHPQYTAFMIIMFGFLVQWPTILTFVMFPVLILMYVRLARKEEVNAEKEFGEAYQEYKKKVPMFLPHIKMLFAIQRSKSESDD